MTAEEGGIAFFVGFAWAVSEAFAPAVCSYRFEQGDVLYRSRSGYAPFEDRIEPGLTAIQLRLPPRSARSIPSESDGDRRRASWQSEVELELVDLAGGRSEIRTTTQGRLLMTLWQGDDAWLDPAHEDPCLPRSARDLAQALRDGEFVVRPPKRGRPGCRFVFVVDLSSDASRAKAGAVEEALQSLGRVARTDRRPDEVGEAGAQPYHPTLVLRELVLRGVAVEAAEAALKRALYGGGGDAERFQIGRHGLLEALGNDAEG